MKKIKRRKSHLHACMNVYQEKENGIRILMYMYMKLVEAD